VRFFLGVPLHTQQSRTQSFELAEVLWQSFFGDILCCNVVIKVAKVARLKWIASPLEIIASALITIGTHHHRHSSPSALITIGTHHHRHSSPLALITIGTHHHHHSSPSARITIGTHHHWHSSPSALITIGTHHHRHSSPSALISHHHDLGCWCGIACVPSLLSDGSVTKYSRTGVSVALPHRVKMGAAPICLTTD
jgi:hypothetical protein